MGIRRRLVDAFFRVLPFINAILLAGVLLVFWAGENHALEVIESPGRTSVITT